MGNKILGKRSRSFYRGFNQKQVDYLKQKFQMFSSAGKLDQRKFMQVYQLTQTICTKFLGETDFDQDSSVDQYQFICMVHTLCSYSIEELGKLFYKVLTRNNSKLNEKSLLEFTKTCLLYNAYIDKKQITDAEINKANMNKFKKYDFNKDKQFDQKQFIKICLKDEDYKKWMFNMGFISKRQMQFQQDVYDLVDSDIGDEVDRHDRQNKQNISKIKQGIQHRIDDDQFGVVETVGEQSAPVQSPWVTQTKKIPVQIQNKQPPNQSLQIKYVFGYRSFDCRNNVKFDSKGKIVYHQAAIGIVLDPVKNSQDFIIQHHDDITCLDVVGDTVVTGETGAKPQVIMWQTNKKDQILMKKMIINEELKDGISSITLTKNKLAVVCNDPNHKIVIYDVKALEEKQKNPTSNLKTIVALGSTSTNIPFDLKFSVNQKYVVMATLRQLLFISFEKGTLNSNRGAFGNFTVTSALCLLPLKTSDKQQFVVSGMGNGSLYFWQNETCVKAITGHQGSVSSICAKKDTNSFISGDKSGKIIIWTNKFVIEKVLNLPKTNCPSNMIVSLSHNNSEILVGTKASDIFTIKLPADNFDKAKKIMSGHNDGQLWALAVHRVQNYLYTGGEDQRLIKWQYIEKKKIQMQRKLPYAIRSIDLYNNEHLKQNMMVVGYKNGVVQCFNPENLQSLNKKFTKIKNPDEETLNLVRINKDGTMCIACYQFPKFKIVLLNLVQNQIKVLSEIPVSSKVIAVDFDINSKYIRFNTQKKQYLVYNIDEFTKPKQIKNSQQLKFDISNWATHTLPYSPQTQGVFSQGVDESDIISCERSRKYINVFVTGDKFSKIKLFNYPSKQNKIYNKYVGHSNQVTGLQFDRRNQHLISIGGQQKSIIIWQYNSEELKNQWYIKQLAPESDIENQELSQERLNKRKLLGEFDVDVVQGEQATATKAFLGQVKFPPDFKQKYNSRRDNQLPQQNLSIRHVFGLRNKYINDQVRNQVKFSSGTKQIVFPTACLAVKMSIRTKQQTFYHEHREDIVSFAIDPSRKIMATGQMAQKNPSQPRKKIVCICVWDIQGNKLLNKLDGFHTIAVVLLSFSPNGKLLYSVGNDDKNSFAIYDWISGAIVYSGPSSQSKVNGIAWKTNEQFMTCGMDHVKFWTGPKSMLGKIQKTDGKIQSMFSCVSSKQIYITGGGEGGIFNWLGNKSQKTAGGHQGKVHTLVYFEDHVYSGGDDGNIFMWKTQANGQIKDSLKFYDTRSAFTELLKTVKNIPERQFGVLSLDINQKRQFLIGTVGASVIYCKNQKNSQIVHQGHCRGELWGLTTQNNKNQIITAGDDKSVRVWDIENRKQINRMYFDQKVRGIDWSKDGSKVVVADARAKLYLFNSKMTDQLNSYTGKPFDFNKGQKIDPFIEDIKFSPDSRMVAYGCHGKSMYMQILNVDGSKLTNKKTFTHGSSALLHVDWSEDSSKISINTQAYQLLFFSTDGKQIAASALAGQNWDTWTRKFGFQVKGIFQGVDYSDVNTVCRDPRSKFIAVGYDDQSIRIFKYPCYIDKQVFKAYQGHSSHVTRIRFTQDYMVSLGGNDRTIIVWNVDRKVQDKNYKNEDSDDGLDDLEGDVDLPAKAVTRKQKVKKQQDFYLEEDEGDEFMAIKPWLGAIKQPTYKYPKQTDKKPNSSIKLQYVHGYRVKDCRQNLYYADKSTIIFHAAAVLIYHNIQKNTQQILDPHNDDILSIDYHKQTNQVITGQLGPKPSICLFRNGALVHTFHNVVKKGILALAISPDGRRAVCAGMDDDHHVGLMDLQDKSVIAVSKGTKKVITKIVWTSNSTFVTVGICHFKSWSFDNKGLTGKDTNKKYNFVSAVYDEQTKRVFTGASKGTIVPWSGTSAQKQINLVVKKGSKQQTEQTPASVVECLLIEKQWLLAGTKNGSIYVIDKKQKLVMNQIKMQQHFQSSNVKSQCSAIRSLNINNQKLLVGTLGSQIYELDIQDLTSSTKPFKKSTNILKCHYSPNNTWTNQVWGLDIKDDYIFSCSDDATVRCWSISQRKLLCCASTNNFQDEKGSIYQLEKDSKTSDYDDAAKSRAVCVSPDGKQVVVGSKNGTVRIFTFSQNNQTLRVKNVFRHAKQWISDIKFGYNTLIIGSHDNAIYVYNYEDGKIKRKYAPMRKHSSYITHLDVSQDSCFLQSTCGAYQLLFWDLNTGKQITNGATMLKDQRWATWTCNLGWPVQGIYPKCEDGTFINAVDRSNLSVRNTLSKDDTKTPFLLAAGNDNGKVALYNYPCTIKSSNFVQGRGHSSHVTNVKWTQNDKYLISVGGEDQCLMVWKVDKKQ